MYKPKEFYWESGGIEEFDVDMMVDQDLELNLLEIATILNALDSIIYKESETINPLMRKLKGILYESLVVLPFLDWEDPDLIELDEDDEGEDDEDEGEDDEDEDEDEDDDDDDDDDED
jgi:hypothetical protein